MRHHDAPFYHLPIGSVMRKCDIMFSIARGEVGAVNYVLKGY